MSAEPIPVEADLAARLDVLTEQVAAIAEELRLQRESREKWSELSDTLVPVTRGAMDVATRELENLDLSDEVTVDDAADAWPGRLPAASRSWRAQLAQVGSSELGHEVNSISGAGDGQADRGARGRRGEGLLRVRPRGQPDRRPGRDRVQRRRRGRSGDNVVTILNAVKEMTQPEVMGLVQRTAHDGPGHVEEEHVEPPSMFALLKSMRDPQTRRGLARVMSMLHTVGEEHPQSRTYRTP
jgi:hypothetical protein